MDRFSQLYLNRGEPLADSDRARRRLYAAFKAINTGDRLDRQLASLLESELGATAPIKSNYIDAYYDWKEFFEVCELRDLLDIITLVNRLIDAKSGNRQWIDSVNRIFREENLRYKADERGCVHFAIDAEFERNVSATIKVLDARKFVNVLEQFERGLAELDAVPPSGKAAVRNVFSSVEGLFRLIFPKAHRLAGDQIDAHLKLTIEARFKSDAAARQCSLKLMKSFKEWVDSAHFYRHEVGQIESAEPPLQLTVQLVSAGAGWARWLAEFEPE